jgi:hypothetical protein
MFDLLIAQASRRSPAAVRPEGRPLLFQKTPPPFADRLFRDA